VRHIRVVAVALAAIGIAAAFTAQALAAPPAPGEMRPVPAQCGPTGCASGQVMSPDGRDAYALVAGPGNRKGVVALHRAPGATLQTPVAGPLGCIGPVPGRSCQTLDPRPKDANPPIHSIAISPDGRFVYLEGGDADLYAFARDVPSGKLIPLWGPGSCVGHFSVFRCDDGPLPIRTEISSISSNVILMTVPRGGPASPTGVMSMVQRDPVTGRVSEKPRSCFGGITCSPAFDVQTARVAGTNLYTVGQFGAIRIFTQQPAGRWVQAAGIDACVGAPGCTAPLNTPTDVIVAPDGTSLYAVGFGSIAVYHRNPASGRLAATGICYQPVAACVPGVLDPADHTVPQLAFRADGTGGLLVNARAQTFARNTTTGALTTNTPTNPCATLTAAGLGCPSTPFAALSGNGVFGQWGPVVLAVERPPSCDNRARHGLPGAPLSISFRCSDLNGDPFTVSVSNPPLHGTLSGLTPAGIVYHPAPGFIGSDTITLHLTGAASADVVIPIAVAATSTTEVTDIQNPDPFFTTEKSPSVPRVAVFYRDPVVLTAEVRHGGEAVAGATVRATGFGGVVTGGTDDEGRADVIVPALRSHRLTFALVGPPAASSGKVDLEVSPDIRFDRFYKVRKGKIVYGAKLLAQGTARAGRVDLQKRVHGRWRTVQKLKIDRRLHFLAKIPKAQYRGPWRFSYVAKRAPYFPAVYDFTLAKPPRVARLAGTVITGRVIAGRRHH
jgi:hypothetical protein